MSISLAVEFVGLCFWALTARARGKCAAPRESMVLEGLLMNSHAAGHSLFCKAKTQSLCFN